MRKTLPVVLAICAISAAVSGCGRQKPTAADSVKAIYDLYIHRDFSGVSSLGMTEKQFEEAMKAYDDALAETMRANFSVSGLEIDEETISEICQARTTALATMEADFTVVSEKNDTATVRVSTTYFDEVELDTDAAYSAREEADAAGFTDYDAYRTFLMEHYTQNLIDGYHAISPSQERKDFTVECIIINNTWIPQDMAAFGNRLAQVMAGQE